MMDELDRYLKAENKTPIAHAAEACYSKIQDYYNRTDMSPICSTASRMYYFDFGIGYIWKEL